MKKIEILKTIIKNKNPTIFYHLKDAMDILKNKENKEKSKKIKLNLKLILRKFSWKNPIDKNITYEFLTNVRERLFKRSRQRGKLSVFEKINDEWRLRKGIVSSKNIKHGVIKLNFQEKRKIGEIVNLKFELGDSSMKKV